MTIIRALIAAVFVSSALTAVSPSSATITTFASYSGIGGQNIYWRRTGTTSGTGVNSPAATAGGQLYTIAAPGQNSPGTAGTKFAFQSPSPGDRLTQLAALGTLKAAFTFSAVADPGTPDIVGGGFNIQQLSTGTFSFIYTGVANLVVDHTTYYTGANLLTATFFSGGAIFGRNASTSGNVGGSTQAGNTVVYTSDFLNFTPTVDKDFSLALSSITPGLGRGGVGQALSTFFATSTGSFSADPAPLPTAIIPEPATWGLLVVGFGLVGLQGRRRKSSTPVAA